MPSDSLPAAVDVSPRVRLARLALDAALAVPDVLGAEADQLGVRMTADQSGGLLRGVSVIAQADGRYAVDLRLITRLVPLATLGEEVRGRVGAAARRDGLGDQLGSVNVEFADLLTDEEARRRAVEDAARIVGGGAPATEAPPTAASDAGGAPGSTSTLPGPPSRPTLPRPTDEATR